MNENVLINDIKSQWDNNVEIRATDIKSGYDDSYINYIIPWVLNKIKASTNHDSTILDIGCGCGYLTNVVFNSGRKNIVGIDISPKSIEYAKNDYPNLQFVNADICSISESVNVDYCISVMTLNNFPYLDRFLKACYTSLKKSGNLLILIPHPCFWPLRHIKDETYVYEKEKIYKFHFSTKGSSEYVSNMYYFHRKVETYINTAITNQFIIGDFKEIFERFPCDKPDMLGLELIKK